MRNAMRKISMVQPAKIYAMILESCPAKETVALTILTVITLFLNQNAEMVS
jgi:hypothetical protein